MKIIDFERKGNIVRFYLGKDDLTEWWGDDWNDYPYDCNAGTVYDEYVSGTVDVVFPFDSKVYEPCDGILNCDFSKEEMIQRKTPCIIVVPEELIEDSWCDSFHDWVGSDKVAKFYFGDTYGTLVDTINPVDGKIIMMSNK